MSKKKREKEEDRKYRENLLAIMAKEKEQKLASANAAKAGGIAIATTPSDVPSVVAPVAKTSASNVATRCQLSIRIPDGTNLRRAFKPDATLFAVVRFINEKLPGEVDEYGSPRAPSYRHFQLQTNFPMHKFDSTEMSKTLLELGLCPSASLIARAQ